MSAGSASSLNQVTHVLHCTAAACAGPCLPGCLLQQQEHQLQ